MKGRVRGKKRELRMRSVPPNHPDRGRFIVESMQEGRCPDCQAKLIESTDPELVDFLGVGEKAFECPKCHWQGVLGE